MFRLTSKMIRTPNPVARWVQQGLQVNLRQHLTRGPHAGCVRLFGSLTTNTTNRRDNMPGPRIERKLGAYESFLFECGQDKGWSHICKCVVIQSKIELTPEQIMKALEKLQRRHLVLRMAVTLKNGENYFAEVPDALDFEVLQTTDKKAVIANEENKWMTFEQLLWRSKLLKPETSEQGFLYPFIFTFHACMFDGTTLFTNLYPDFLNILETSFDQDGDKDTESFPLLPPREHLLDLDRDINIELGLPSKPVSSQNDDQIAPNDWESNQALAIKLHEMHKPSQPDRGSGLLDFVLDKKQTSQLMNEVAEHDVSLNNVCVAANAMAIYRLQNDLGILSDQGWSLQSPFVVDLRRYAMPTPPVSHSGVFVGELSNNIIIPANMLSCNSGALWELAASIKKENRKLLANPEQFLASMRTCKALYNGIFQLDREAFYRAVHPILDLFYLSLYGHYTLPPAKGKVNLHRMELLTGTRGPTIFTHNIHRLDSSSLIRWGLSYSKMLVSDELAETYLLLAKKELERYLLK